MKNASKIQKKEKKLHAKMQTPLLMANKTLNRPSHLFSRFLSIQKRIDFSLILFTIYTFDSQTLSLIHAGESP